MSRLARDGQGEKFVIRVGLSRSELENNRPERRGWGLPPSISINHPPAASQSKQALSPRNNTEFAPPLRHQSSAPRQPHPLRPPKKTSELQRSRSLFCRFGAAPAAPWPGLHLGPHSPSPSGAQRRARGGGWRRRRSGAQSSARAPGRTASRRRPPSASRSRPHPSSPRLPGPNRFPPPSSSRSRQARPRSPGDNWDASREEEVFAQLLRTSCLLPRRQSAAALREQPSPPPIGGAPRCWVMLAPAPPRKSSAF